MNKITTKIKNYLKTIDYTEWFTNTGRSFFRWCALPSTIYIILFLNPNSLTSIDAINVFISYGLVRVALRFISIPKKEDD